MPRARKPIAQHKLQGTYRPSEHRKRRDLQAPGALGPPPDHLGETARQVWDEVNAVAPPGLLAAADRFVVAAFAVAVAAWRDAVAMRAQTPLLLRTSREGRPAFVTNPLTGEIRRQARLIADLGAELGLTPGARLRLMDGVTAPEKDVTDPEFLKMFGPLRLISGDRA